VLVEFSLGNLPWRKMKDKEAIGNLKEKFTTKELVKDLPKEFTLFLESLQKLGYGDDPDYDELRSLLLQVYSKEGYSSKQPFDWEINEENKDKDMNPPQLEINLLNDDKKENQEKNNDKDTKDTSEKYNKDTKTKDTKDTKTKDIDDVKDNTCKCLIQ